MSEQLSEKEYEELLRELTEQNDGQEGLDLLINNFSLVPADEPVHLPEEPKIAVRVDGLARGERFWYAKEMAIDVRFNKKIEVRSQFELRLAFGSLKPASNKTISTLRKGQIGRLHVNLEACGLYTAGEYVLQMKVNDIPYLEYSFSVDEEGKVSEGKTTLLSEHSAGSFLMGRELDFDEGRMVMGFCGCKEVKELLAHLVKLRKLNDLRTDLMIPRLLNNGYVLYDNGKQDMDELSVCMAKILFGNNVDETHIDYADEDTDDTLHTPPFDHETHRCWMVTGFSALMGNGSSNSVNGLLKFMKHKKSLGRDLIVFVGSEQELKSFFKMYPQFGKFFPKQNRVHTGGETVTELISMVFEFINMNNFQCTTACRSKLIVGLKKAWEKELVKGVNEEDVEYFVSNYVLENQGLRLMRDDKCLKASKEWSQMMMKTIEAEDVDFSSFYADQMDEFEDRMSRLDELVGLSELKQNLRDFFLQTRFELRRRELGLSNQSDNRHHMLFTGNPGTGKTTVAMLMGKVFHAMGLLSKGDVVKVDRASLVGEYIGQTEKNVSGILKQARGNVLFVDEAYALFSDKDDSRDYGKRVVETLLSVLAEPNPDILVIFAGYKEDIERLMSMNDGLKGRFPHEFFFPDFTADELTLIGRNLLEKNGYVLLPETEACMKSVVNQMLLRKDKKFANARWMTDFVNVQVLKHTARRVTAIAKPQKKDYQLVLKEDVLAAWQELCQKQAKNPDAKRIGFVA